MKAVELVKCGLAGRSRFVWLQTDWIGSCEQGFLEDRGLDRIMLVCDSEILGGCHGFDLERPQSRALKSRPGRAHPS